MFKLNSAIMSKFNQDFEYEDEDDEDEEFDEVDGQVIEENKSFYSMNTGHLKPKTKIEVLNALFQGLNSDDDEEQLGDEVDGLQYPNPLSVPYQEFVEKTNSDVSTKAKAHAEFSQEVIEPRFLPHDHEQRLLQDVKRGVNVYSDLLSDAQWAASQGPGPSTQNQYISPYHPPLSTYGQTLTSGVSNVPLQLQKLSITYGLQNKNSGIDVTADLHDSLSQLMSECLKNTSQKPLDGGNIPSTSKTETGLNLIENNKFAAMFNGSDNAGDEYLKSKPNVSTEDKLLRGHRLENYKNILNSVMSSKIDSNEFLDTVTNHPKMAKEKEFRKDLKIIEQPIEEMPELVSLYSNDSNITENLPDKMDDPNGNTNCTPIDNSTATNKRVSENTGLSSAASQSQINSISNPKSELLINSMSMNDNKVKLSTSESSCQTDPVLFSTSSISELETNKSKKSKTLLSFEELKREYESSSEKKDKTSFCLKFFRRSRKSSKLKQEKDDSDEGQQPSNP